MRESLVADIKQAIRLTAEDAANIRALAPVAVPAIPDIVRVFYKELLEHETAQAVFTGGVEQIKRLHGTLTQWLEDLFQGNYDEGYFERRRSVGAAHVRVGLPQHYMFTTMQLIWRELERPLRSAGIPDIDGKLRSLHKSLMLELALMIESFKESYTDRVRQVERSAVEEKLTRAEHLAEIGQLAASLAHEIKNPLAGISGAIQIIRDALPETDVHQPILTEMLGQIGRLDATVKDLLQYARPSPPKAVKVALDEVIKRVLTVLHEEPALRGVKIKYDNPPVDTAVLADEAQIEQLLINLIINAAHASVEGGVVRLRVARNTNEVRVVVQDRGKGMSPEECARAFEPFYTTKARGTGLGLTICRRIAEANGGDIRLDSEMGRGTTVTVTLPLKATESAVKAQA